LTSENRPTLSQCGKEVVVTKYLTNNETIIKLYNFTFQNLIYSNGLVLVVFFNRIPYLVTNYGMLIALFESLFTIFVISTLVMSTFMDPGKYSKGEKFTTLIIWPI